MAEVIVTLRILPKSLEVDLDKLEVKIKSIVKPEKIQREPIAFGLIALLVTKLIPDTANELENMENRIKSIEGVGQIEVTQLTRSL